MFKVVIHQARMVDIFMIHPNDVIMCCVKSLFNLISLRGLYSNCNINGPIGAPKSLLEQTGCHSLSYAVLLL